MNAQDCWEANLEGKDAYSDIGYSFVNASIIGDVNICFGESPKVSGVDHLLFEVVSVGSFTVMTISRTEDLPFGMTVEVYQINRKSQTIHYTRTRTGGRSGLLPSAVGGFSGKATKIDPSEFD